MADRRALILRRKPIKPRSPRVSSLSAIPLAFQETKLLSPSLNDKMIDTTGTCHIAKATNKRCDKIFVVEYLIINSNKCFVSFNQTRHSSLQEIVIEKWEENRSRILFYIYIIDPFLFSFYADIFERYFVILDRGDKSYDKL